MTAVDGEWLAELGPMFYSVKQAGKSRQVRIFHFPWRFCLPGGSIGDRVRTESCSVCPESVGKVASASEGKMASVLGQGPLGAIAICTAPGLQWEGGCRGRLTCLSPAVVSTSLTLL